MPTPLGDVRFRGKSGKHLLGVSISPFDPTRTLSLARASPITERLEGGDSGTGKAARPTAWFKFLNVLTQFHAEK